MSNLSEYNSKKNQIWPKQAKMVLHCAGTITNEENNYNSTIKEWFQEMLKVTRMKMRDRVFLFIWLLSKLTNANPWRTSRRRAFWRSWEGNRFAVKVPSRTIWHPSWKIKNPHIPKNTWAMHIYVCMTVYWTMPRIEYIQDNIIQGLPISMFSWFYTHRTRVILKEREICKIIMLYPPLFSGDDFCRTPIIIWWLR